MSKRSLVALVVCLATYFLPSFVSADDSAVDEPMFISMSRRPDPVSKLPTNASYITADEIKKLGVTNVPDAIRFIPGVKIEGSGAQGAFSKIKIRGVPSSNLVQVVVDDQPLGGSSVQNIDVSLIPIEDVERIEVVRGGASLYGANTVGGVVHIITKRAAKTRGAEVSYEGQSFKTNIHRYQVEAKENHADAMATYRHMDTNGFQDDAEADQKYFSGNFGYSFENGGRVSFDYSDLDQFQDLTSGTPVPFEQWDGHKEKASNGADSTLDKNSRRARNKIAIPIGVGLLQNVASYSGDQRETVTPFLYAQSMDEIWANDTRMILDNGFTAGFAYERDQRRAFDNGSHHITNIAGYIGQEFKAGSLIMTPALRVEDHSLFGTEYNPRLTVVEQISNSFKVSGNAARSVRAPTLTDLYEDFPDTLGDPVNDFHHNSNLKPEVAWTYDLGFEAKSDDAITFSGTGFYTNIKDRIVAVDSDGLLNAGFPFFGVPPSLTNDTLGNAAKAEICGGEISLQMKTGSITQNMTYTYQRSKTYSVSPEDPHSTQYVDTQMTPRHIANYQLDINLGQQTNLMNTLQYVSHQYERDNRQGAILHPYAVWNARLDKSWNVFGTFVGVDNILNRRYGESVTFGVPVPQPTRTFKAGISAKFGA